MRALVVARRARARLRRRSPARRPAQRQGAVRPLLRSCHGPNGARRPRTRTPARRRARPGGAGGRGPVAARRRRARRGLLPRAPATCRCGGRGDQPRRAPRRFSATRRSTRSSPTSRRSATGRPSRRRIRSAATSPQGLQLFTAHCAGCHQIVGAGRLRHGRGRAAARRRDADADRRGGAHRAVRDAEVLDEARSPTASSTRSSRYVEYAKHPDDRGGWSIGHIGPIPEGLVDVVHRRHRARRRLHRDREEAAWLRAQDWLLAGLVLLARARPRAAARRRDARADRRAARAATRRRGRGARPARAVVALLRRLRRRLRRRPDPAPDAAPRPRARARARLLRGRADRHRASGSSSRRSSSRSTRRAEHPAEQATIVARSSTRAATRLTRRRLFKLGAARRRRRRSALALLTPALLVRARCSTIKAFFGTPWRRGRRLVDENGRPLPRRRDRGEAPSTPRSRRAPTRRSSARRSSSSACRRAALDLPPELPGYDADGIVAYSKICTHAGCAIALYRAPTFAPDEPRPALVCPCHYSTFDPATGGTVLFGPAGRPLPHAAAARSTARATCAPTGNFDGAVGPSWWGVAR